MDKLASIQVAGYRLLSVAYNRDYDVKAVHDYEEDLGVMVTVNLIVTNHTKTNIRDLEFNLSNDKDVKFCPDIGRDFKINEQAGLTKKLINFVVAKKKSKETEFQLVVNDTTKSHKVRGTLTYIHELKDGETAQDKLDFWLHVGLHVFLMEGPQMTPDDFDRLLQGGSLKHQQTLTLLPLFDDGFPKLMDQLCSACNLCLVERVGDTAMLFGFSLFCDNVCLLIKSDVSNITIEGKSTSGNLLESVLAQIKSVLST